MEKLTRNLLLVFSLTSIMLMPFFTMSQNAWINEIHYSNAGTDVNEAVEVIIENPQNYSLAAFHLTLVDGDDGSSYYSIGLNSFIAGTQYGNYRVYYTYFPSMPGIQDGSPDGLALDYQGNLIPGQFLSYEGGFMGWDAPVGGEESADIGVWEDEIYTPVGYSLQLAGMGFDYADFSWQQPATATLGTLNNNQLFDNQVGSIGIGTITPSSCAILDIHSETKGIRLPTMSTARRTAITSPPNGLIVFDETEGSLFIYINGTWRNLLSNNTGWSTTGNAGTLPSTQFLGTTDSVWSSGSTNYPGFKMKVNNRQSALIEIINKNVAFGYRAMELTTTGYWNTAFGYQALQRNLTTGYNTAVGFRAMQWGYGPYVTCIGHATDCYSLTITNCSAFGDGATVNATSKIRIGDATMNVIEGQVPWSTPSDGRFKMNVSEAVPGLDFIKLLHPVTYNFDTKAYTQWLIKEMPPEMQEERLLKDFGASSAMLHTGFVAQEVEQAAKSLGFDFDGIHVPVHEGDNYSIAYSQFVVPLVKAVQEQQTMIEELTKQNTELIQRVQALESKK